jgi:sugar phosphate permease
VHVIIPTVAMLAVLTVGSMANLGIGVMAPEAAPDIGVAATDIGVFTAIVYVFAMFSGTVSGAFIRYYGGIRVTQFTSLCTAAGMAVIALASPAAAVVSAILLGLAYGPFNPASGHVLVNIATPRWRPLVFSVKQVGVPLGGALAGALIPLLIIAFGWQGAALAVCMIALVITVVVQPLRNPLDTDRRSGPLLASVSVREPVMLVLRHRGLRKLALAGFAYAGCQVCVGSFFVVYLTQSLAMSLVEAGLVFAFVQTGGIAGRVLWGTLAERWLGTRALLAVLGLLIAACLLTAAAFTIDWPRIFIAGVGFVLGACSYGWVGIYLSEVASLAPEGRVGDATGGAQFVHFSGAAVIPPAFGAIVTLLNSFAAAFVVIAAVATLAGLYVAWPGKMERAR